MANTKLLSLRVDYDALHKLEEFQKFFPYTKAHAIMVGILENILLNIDSKTLRDLVFFNRHSSSTLKITIEKVDHVEQPR